MKSIFDKINDITVKTDGTVVHNVLLKPEGNGPREFKNMETFINWRRKHLRERREYLKTKLTPQ